VGSIFAEVIERVLKANRPLTGPNMKAALEGLSDWDSGGISGLPINLKGHQIATGRIYRFDANAKLFEPASGWIRTS
jgi:branched-chain amino acid transport system substrate-binding protein